MSRKIVFVNRYAYPDHSATSQMVSDLALWLSGAGYGVAIVTSRQLYDDARAKLPAREAVGGIVIHRVWTSRFGRGWLVGRALDYLSFYLTAAVAVLSITRRGDIVVLKTDPPMLSVILGPLARLRGSSVVNWLQDIFPEIAVALGVRWFGGVFGNIARKIRNSSLESATMNVAIGASMAKHLEAQGTSRDRIAIIANWADGDAIRPLAHADNPLRQEWALTGKFVVAYSGNLGRAHEFATMMAAAELLRSEPDIVFLFIGGGRQYAALEAEAKSRRLASVRCMPYQPRERLRESLAVADAHWISLRPELEGLIVPSKIYGVLAAGRPTLMVGDPDGEIGGLLRRHDCGITVPVGEGALLAATILRLRDAPEKGQAMGRRARAAFDVGYSMEQAFAAWNQLFAILMDIR